MKVAYEHSPVYRGRNLGPVLMLLFLLAAGLAVGHYWGTSGALVVSLASLALFGVNTVTYETPVTGTTAPTFDQSRNHQSVAAVITGDNAATTFVVTHNWGLTNAQIANGWPRTRFEPLLAAYYTANPIVGSKAGGNAVNFTCTAFSGAAFRVIVERPWSPLT